RVRRADRGPGRVLGRREAVREQQGRPHRVDRVRRAVPGRVPLLRAGRELPRAAGRDHGRQDPARPASGAVARGAEVPGARAGAALAVPDRARAGALPDRHRHATAAGADRDRRTGARALVRLHALAATRGALIAEAIDFDRFARYYDWDTAGENDDLDFFRNL